MGLEVPKENLPNFIVAVFCITGTFMWSNLILNTRKFIICLLDSELRIKLRAQYYLRTILFIHSIGTLVCTFPNVLCTVFSQACPTPTFHGFACGGATLAEGMSQAVLAARLYLFQFKSKNRSIAIISILLITARLVVGVFQCATIEAFEKVPVWGYWIPIQNPRTLSAVYSLDFVNNIFFTGLFSLELLRHYRSVEKHTNQTGLYRMRQILQSAAVGGILAGLGTIILAVMIITGIAKNEMQIVCIFSELAWNSSIITSMINGPQDSNSKNPNESTTSPSPGDGKRPIEMSLLTSASVFGARLEAPEPIAERKSPDELRDFQYDHGVQNRPAGKSELAGVRRVEEQYRVNLENQNPDIAPPSPYMPNVERINTNGGTPELHPLDSPSHINDKNERDSQ